MDSSSQLPGLQLFAFVTSLLQRGSVVLWTVMQSRQQQTQATACYTVAHHQPSNQTRSHQKSGCLLGLRSIVKTATSASATIG